VIDQRSQQVFGHQINAKTINLYLTEQKQLARRNWRKLEHLEYPTLERSAHAKEIFLSDICFAMHAAFSGLGFKRFATLMRIQNTTISEEAATVLVLDCHEAVFVDALRREASDRLELIDAARQAPPDRRQEKRQEYFEFVKNREARLDGWQLRYGVRFSLPTSALDIQYDPTTKTVSVETSKIQSLNPVDYPDKLSTTSDLLRFIAATGNVEYGLLTESVFKLAHDDVRIWKLAVSVLDKEPILLDQIRVDVNDLEYWDYSNPRLDEELLTMGRSANA
jgi:hypothetical protein